MIRSVIPEFRQCQPIRPFARTVVHKTAEIKLHALVDPLRSAISLRMSRRRDIQMGMCQLAQLLPHSTSEDTVAVGHHFVRRPMQLENVLQIGFCHLQGRVRVTQRNEVCVPCQLVDHHQN